MKDLQKLSLNYHQIRTISVFLNLLNVEDCVPSSFWVLDVDPPVDALSLSWPDIPPKCGLAIPPLVLLLAPAGAGTVAGVGTGTWCCCRLLREEERRPLSE